MGIFGQRQSGSFRRPKHERRFSRMIDCLEQRLLLSGDWYYFFSPMGSDSMVEGSQGGVGLFASWYSPTDDPAPDPLPASIAGAVTYSTTGGASTADFTGPSTVEIIYSGPPDGGGSFAGGLWVTANRDNFIDPGEGVVATLHTTGDAIAGLPPGSTPIPYPPNGSDTTWQFTITDDPPMVSIVATDADTSEVPIAKGTPNIGVFRISRTGGDITQALEVDYSVSGTAADSDYTLSGSATIPANTLFSDIIIIPVFDNIAEADEIVILTVDESSDYTRSVSATSASISIADAGEMSLSSLVSTLQDPSDQHQSFETSSSSASTGFVVYFDTVDKFGQPIGAAGVTDQEYTISVSGNATIASVTDSLGNIWTFSGTSASTSIEGLTTGQTFEIYVSLLAAGPGVIDVELNANATRGITTYSSKSSSAGRAIAPVANPGPVVVPTKIYHILDHTFGGGAGHSGVIIPHPMGCIYMSYAADGTVTLLILNNIDDAFAAAKAAGYTKYQSWKCNGTQATRAIAAAGAFNNTDYHATMHNCWHMVYSALEAADAPVIDNGAGPSNNFQENSGTAVDSGNL